MLVIGNGESPKDVNIDDLPKLKKLAVMQLLEIHTVTSFDML